ncbi:PepSY-associated TM helix domain-containing protein [Rheinheimera soli]|uniref:Iron-regulated membrane protein n=1 Tax=Rheinheimera soli TaxID=443616 RepID=A0ABU1W095_9GAMM|nr:PepSY-associated TM helix domain-containing protein [Rheinheimera soli]MDR7121400.1 putative iron-regulated membrane protein [Rheinheimera soli]
MQRHHFELHQFFAAAFGFLLLLLSVSGTMAVYKTELALWVAGPDRAACPVNTIPQAVLQHAADPQVRRLTLPGYDSSYYQLKYRDGSVLQFDRCSQAANRSGQVLSTFLVELHTRFFFGHEGRWVIGFIAVAMLMSLISGLLSLKKPWSQYVRAGACKKQGRSAWALWHKRLGLLSLPALVLFAVTGIWLGLYGLIIPTVSLWSSEPAPVISAKVTVPALPAGKSAHEYALELSARHFPQLTPVFIEQKFAAEKLVQLSVRGDNPGSLVQRHRSGVDYDIKKSTLTLIDPSTVSLLKRKELMMMPLHFGDWGSSGAVSQLVKLLYMLLGLSCIAIMSAGLWLWAFRRQRYSGWLSAPSFWPGRLVFASSAAFALTLLASPFIAKCLLFFAVDIQQTAFYTVIGSCQLVLVAMMLLTRTSFRCACWCTVMLAVASILLGISSAEWWHGFHVFLMLCILSAVIALHRSYSHSAIDDPAAVTIDAEVN